MFLPFQDRQTAVNYILTNITGETVKDVGEEDVQTALDKCCKADEKCPQVI